MSQDAQKDQKEQSPVAAIFQKTHAKMMTLTRIEEQFASLAMQRAKLQEELRALQGEINAELDRVVEGSTTISEADSMKIKAAA
jgi:hypothetical protein